MKKIITKIFLSTFVFGFFSFGLNFVYAGTLTTVDDPSKCSEIINYSSNGYSANSTNGTTYATNSQIIPWYINNISAISLSSVGNDFDAGVCVNDYTTLADKNIGRKVDLCKTDISKLRDYQKSLFDAYITKKNINVTRGFDGHKQVWGLQNIMSQNDINCHTNKDCKLGVNTTSDFLFCNVCEDLGDGRTELESLDPKKCPTNSIFAGAGDICCLPGPTECKQPIITIGNGINTYQGNDDLVVKVDYSKNDIGTLSYNFENISVSGATNKEDYSTGDKFIQFTITPQEGKDKISIDVQEGYAVLGADKNCPQVNIDINRKIDCQLTKNRKDCNNITGIDSQPQSGFTGFSSLLSDGIMCEKGALTIPFCPDQCTSRKIDSQTCEQIYGSGRFDDGNGCCMTCGENQVQSGSTCVCDKIGQKPPEGKKLDKNSCKRVCDPTKTCCGIELNTVVPFIGDCIEMTSQNDTTDYNDPNTSRVNQINAFPFLMMGLSKIMVTVILIFSFLIVIASGLMMTTGVYDESNYKTGMDWIKKIVVALILLGSSGLILKLINPSFFGG